VTLAVYLLAELAAVVGVAMLVGIGWTIVLLLGTGLIGAVLLRINGVKAMRSYREAVIESKPPGPAVVSGVLGVAGAFLLLLPGFVSDVVGLMCVLPGVRSLLRPLVTRFLEKRVDSPSMNRFFGPRVVRPQQPHQRRADPVFDTDEVIEGEVINDSGDDQPRRRPDEGENGTGPKPLT